MDYDYSYESVSTAISRRRPLHSVPSNAVDKPPEASDAQPSESTTAAGTAADASSSSSSAALRRTLSLADLIFYGVGCSVGAGIYSLVGIGAELAGPGIAVSFLLCGLACCFTSLAYAEFAARVPLAGSAYTFTYVSFGELSGWLVGWNLTLGYAVSASAVARSWAEYVAGFLRGVPVLSGATTTALLGWAVHAPVPWLGGDGYGCCPLAAAIIGLCTLVLVTGAKESARFNTAMTLLNLSILAFVVLAGVSSGSVDAANLTPFFPNGARGVGRAAGLVFFSYLGFDMVSCLSEEVKDPERNMPIGIIGSLVASMAVYCTVSLAVVGMAPIAILGGGVPIVNALLSNACCTHEEQLRDVSGDSGAACLSYLCEPVLRPVLLVGSRVVSFGAIFGLTAATFACLMGQPRIFYSMAQDGLLFRVYGRVHPRTGVPTAGTVLTGILTALVACAVDLESLANAISLGTLQVFTFVNAGVIILRMTPPVQDPAARSGGEDDDDPSAVTAAAETGAPPSLHHLHPDERSPLLPDEGGAVLIKTSSSRAVRHAGAAAAPCVPPTRVAPSAAGLEENGSWPHWLTLGFTVCATLGSVGLSSSDEPWPTAVLVTLGGAMLAFAAALSRLRQAAPPSTFTCPWVPLVPLMGIACNSYLMGSMPLETWAAIAVWLLAGLAFYFGYGMHHSELRKNNPNNGGGTGTGRAATITATASRR